MADPIHDLAPIIAPPPPAPAGHHIAVGPAGPGTALVCVIIVAAFVLYRRRAPLRALRRIAASQTPQAGADALAALVARGIGANLGAHWFKNLERLRFGRPRPDDAELLARLCGEAEDALTRRPRGPRR